MWPAHPHAQTCSSQQQLHSLGLALAVCGRQRLSFAFSWGVKRPFGRLRGSRGSGMSSVALRGHLLHSAVQLSSIQRSIRWHPGSPSPPHSTLAGAQRHSQWMHRCLRGMAVARLTGSAGHETPRATGHSCHPLSLRSSTLCSHNPAACSCQFRGASCPVHPRAVCSGFACATFLANALHHRLTQSS